MIMIRKTWQKRTNPGTQCTSRRVLTPNICQESLSNNTYLCSTPFQLSWQECHCKTTIFINWLLFIDLSEFKFFWNHWTENRRVTLTDEQTQTEQWIQQVHFPSHCFVYNENVGYGRSPADLNKQGLSQWKHKHLAPKWWWLYTVQDQISTSPS